MSFFSSKVKQTYTLVVSLKSSSIDLQLMSTNSQNKREVLFVERNIIFLENSQEPSLYTAQYSKELTHLFTKNHTKIKQIIQNQPLCISIVLFPPWFTSSITSFEHQEQVILNEDFLTQNIKTLEVNDALQILERRVIKIQANGYTLDHLTHTKCSDVHVKVYSSYISKNINTLLIDSLKKFFPEHQNIVYTTSPILIFDQIRRFMVREDNAVFLYVDSEITQVGIIENDSLVYFVTFPLGTHDFLREIQSTVQTYDYDLLYQKEIQIKSKKQQEQFDALQKKWANLIIESLALFNKNVPSKILILSHTKTRTFFTDLLTQTIKQDSESVLKNNRFINFDISLLKDIITYKTPTGENELDLKLEALI